MKPKFVIKSADQVKMEMLIVYTKEKRHDAALTKT